MINVTKQFRQECVENRRFYVTANCTFSDRTQIHMKKEDFYSAGNEIVDSSDSADFPLGMAIEKTAVLTLVNDDDRFSDYDFNGARVVIYLNLQLTDRLETVRRGTFIVSKKPATEQKIRLTLLDYMHLADIAYSTNITFPCTAGELLRDACQSCGIRLGEARFLNDDFIIKKKPENTTHRAVIGMIASLAGGNARIDEDDYLRIISFNKDFAKITIYDGGDFRYRETDTLDGGTMNPWTGGEFLDGGTFAEQEAYHSLKFIRKLQKDTDDVRVTGVKFIQEETEYMYGTDGYVINLENTLLLDNIQDGLARIGTAIIGMEMRPFSCTGIANPYATFGDSVEITDNKGRIYRSYLTNIEFTFGASTSFACKVKSAEENAKRFPGNNRVSVELAKADIEKKMDAYDIAVQHMNQLAANTLGFFYTEEKQADGSILSYRHDKPALADSKIIYKSGAEGFFLSTDGGKTWKAGFDSNGDAVLNILYAIGIQAEWINTRGLTAKDNDGKITFRVDAATGRVDIVANSFSLKGRSVEELAKDQVDNFVTQVFNGTVEELQKQIDKQIETFYFDYEPTLDNEPALSWKDETARAQHQGDLFYWKSKGFSYRFMKDGENWKWKLVQDTDITKALKQAAEAKDTADGKRRVFISTPVPPYDAGDLWATSNKNKEAAIKVCKTPKGAGTVFSSADWIEPKYVDKTTVDNAITVYDTSLGQTEVFNKLTNNGNQQGIYIEGGKLYINADYILSGTLAGQRINAKGITVLNKDGKKTFEIDANGNVTITPATFALTSGDTINSIANAAASDALSDAKSYADSLMENIPSGDYTQEEIFNILTNNGQTQGIYLYNGKIYLNAQYIDADAVLANLATIGGWKIQSDGLTSSNETMKLMSDGRIVNLNGSSSQFLLYNPTDGLSSHKLLIAYSCELCSMGGTLYINGSTTINDALKVNYTATFMKPPKIFNLTHVTKGGHLVFASDGATLAYLSESSKRYKNHVAEMKIEEAEKILEIPVVWFEYKDGYLAEDDLRNGKPVPGFYAEDVYEHFPDAADLNADGTVEDWNYRTLIPPMLKLLQEQKKEIDDLKRKLTAIEEKIGGVRCGDKQQSNHTASQRCSKRL